MNIKKVTVLLSVFLCFTMRVYADLNVKTDGNAETTVVFDGEPNVRFADVSENDWFFDDVSFATQGKIMSGISDEVFAPNEYVTRAMAITVLYRLAGEPMVLETETQFDDVLPENYCAPAVAWGVQNKIISGMDDEHFFPNEYLTREQFAVMLFNFDGSDGSNMSKISDFSDFSAVSDWARSALCWTVDKKIISGRDGNFLAPSDFVTRAETAAVIRRYSDIK